MVREMGGGELGNLANLIAGGQYVGEVGILRDTYLAGIVVEHVRNLACAGTAHHDL